MAARRAVIHRGVVLRVICIALLIYGSSPELAGVLLIALIILVLNNVQVLCSVQLNLILQFDGFG